MRSKYLALAFSFLAAACGDPDLPLPALREVQPCRDRACPERCQKLQGTVCDVRDPSCQQRVFEATACVWGFEGEPPPVEVVDEQGLREVRCGESSDTEESGEPDALTPWERALVLLGLRAPGVSGPRACRTQVVNRIDGLYDPEEGSVVLVDRGYPLDADRSVILLAHEFVHALQYRADPDLLDERRAASDDLELAASLGMAVEGDATVHADLAWSLLTGVSLTAQRRAQDLRYWLASAQRDVLESPNPYDALSGLAYPVGGAHLWLRWLDDRSATTSSRQQLPRRVVEWMYGPQRDGIVINPSAYSVPTLQGAPPPDEPLACGAPHAPSGFRTELRTELGADVLFAFWGLRRRGEDGVVDAMPTWRDASRMQHSRFGLYVDEGGNVALAWRIGFVDALETDPDPWVVEPDADWAAEEPVETAAELASRLAADVTAGGDLVAAADEGQVLILGAESASVRWPADTCRD